MTTFRRIAYLLVTCGTVLIWAPSESRGQEPASTADTAENVQAAVEQLAQGGQAMIEARAKLSQLPAEEVVPAICHALELDDRLQTRPKRLQAYQVLEKHYLHTVNIPLGRKSLIAGLQDPSVRTKCAMLLGNAPPESFEKIIPALGKFLSDESIEAYPLAQIVRALGRLGPPAIAHLD